MARARATTTPEALMPTEVAALILLTGITCFSGMICGGGGVALDPLMPELATLEVPQSFALTTLMFLAVKGAVASWARKP